MFPPLWSPLVAINTKISYKLATSITKNIYFRLHESISNYHKHFQNLQLSFLTLPMCHPCKHHNGMGSLSPTSPTWHMIHVCKSNVVHDPCMCHDHGVGSFFLSIQCDTQASTQTFTCKIIAKFWLCKSVLILNMMQHNVRYNYWNF